MFKYLPVAFEVVMGINTINEHIFFKSVEKLHKTNGDSDATKFARERSGSVVECLT